VKLLLSLAIASFAAGCSVNSQNNYQDMRSLLVQQKYNDAANFIEGNKEKFYGENNAVLFYMDKLMALHLAKQYKESNELVSKADDKIEALYTQSVSANVGAFMTNDNVLPYEGEEFEKVLIHVIGSLNYTGLKDKEGALVEARRVEEKLSQLNDRILKGAKDEKDEAAKQRAQYSEDAFIRWFIGAMYETEADMQSLNDALIAYKKALDAYEKSYTPKYKTPTPNLLVQDYYRVATALSFNEDIAMLKKKFPNVPVKTAAETKDKGEVVLIHMNGEAPYKIEKTWEAVADNKVIKVAYPQYALKPKQIAYATVSVSGSEARSETFEDVAAIAVQSLADRMGRVKGKMVGRAIAKFIAAKAAEVATAKASGSGGLGALIGAGASIAGAATEKADIRSWLLLPASIDVAKAYVPAGKHTVTVTFHSAGGGVVRTETINDVEVQAGKKVFLNLRTF
jgi:hypothetical protein